MTNPQKPEDGLEVLLDSLLAELMEMTDAQVLEGVDPAAVQAKGLALLSAAKQEAGRLRLAAARTEVALTNANRPAENTSSVNAADAKAFLREAANSGHFTLAARGLDEMSDDDAIRIYKKLLRLGAGGAVREKPP
jgi:hypothetical protein